MTSTAPKPSSTWPSQSLSLRSQISGGGRAGGRGRVRMRAPTGASGAAVFVRGRGTEASAAGAASADPAVVGSSSAVWRPGQVARGGGAVAAAVGVDGSGGVAACIALSAVELETALIDRPTGQDRQHEQSEG